MFFWKPSGTPHLDEEIRMENEKKKDEELMIDAMKDQDEYLCHFCGSVNFQDKDDFHHHIENCMDQLTNPKV